MEHVRILILCFYGRVAKKKHDTRPQYEHMIYYRVRFAIEDWSVVVAVLERDYEPRY
jgi:hypothetical protein